MKLVVALLSALMFGAGLAISGMVNPRKVLDFLDIAAIASGRWDPTLAFVFLGALPVTFAAFRARARLDRPVLDDRFHISTRQDVDLPLLAGASLFGIGWGLAGICPGPAFAAIPLAGQSLGGIAAFILAMVAGMAIAKLVRSALVAE